MPCHTSTASVEPTITQVEYRRKRRNGTIPSLVRADGRSITARDQPTMPVFETAVIPLVQSDDHRVQANLPVAKTTTHTIRNRNIETAKLACFLNSLKPSLIRVVRRKKIERTKRKIGIAAARKAMTLKITLSVLLRRLAAQLVPPEIRILVQRPRQ